MLRDKTIKKRVWKIIEDRIENAQNVYDKRCIEIDAQKEVEIREIEERSENEKVNVADSLVNSLIGQHKVSENTNPFKVDDKGFTLIELLIVIAIIGIISTVIIGFLNGNIDVSKKEYGNECDMYQYVSAKNIPAKCLKYFSVEGDSIVQ